MAKSMANLKSGLKTGDIEFSGQYKNDARDGLWLIYNNDGTMKYKMEYHGRSNKRPPDGY